MENSSYSSGYESEAATVEGRSVEVARERESRRARTKFTSEQIYKLEKTFNKQKYLDPSGRVKTAAELNLSETQVRTWFQNRRMKLKREVQDWTHHFTPAVGFPAVFLPCSPAFQNHGSTGQRHPFISTALASYQRPLEQIPAQRAQHLLHPICY
ncbi:homeobox protein vent1-like [Conger conger]|uniref:homeobox protein vent1-like n=1 Tax=Conger conger TaxID=82655 RepID=UPI002A5AAADF|nr:homeobox protein vent1-like [Conger conger]